MSIILTAGRHAVSKSKQQKKPKKQNHHKQDGQGTGAPATPPISTEGTVVWYWLLEGVATTVMYTKASCEVWCNGATLDTEIDFGDDTGSGAHVDFMIQTPRLQYNATIKKVVIPGGCISHQLFVGDYMILEHMGQPPADSTTLITRAMADTELGRGPEIPPYDELYPIQEPKKTK